MAARAYGTRLTPADEDAYGLRFVLDFPMAGDSGPVLVRSAWIVRDCERVSRFVSCYVL